MSNETSQIPNTIAKYLLGLLLILVPTIGLMILGGWDVMFVALPTFLFAFGAMFGKRDSQLTLLLWGLAITCGALTWGGFAFYIVDRM
jgi:hypothetical protein